MMSDEIRPSGDDTLLNIEMDDAWRKVTVTREALENHLKLSPEQAESLGPDGRCRLVRENLAFVFAGVRRKLRARPDAQRITLLSGEM
jgi:hypothetical protein